MTLTMLLMSGQVLLIGALMAATPSIMPPTECFTVTIPPSAQHDPRIRGYRRMFALVEVLVSAACALGLALALPRLIGADPATSEDALAISTTITIATLAPIATGAALMLYFRSRVRALKQAEGWTAHAQQAAAIISEDVPKPISIAWNLLYVPLTLAMVAFALLNYDRFPEQIPMNMDFSGEVTTYATKSVGVVLFPAITVGYMGLVFALCHLFTIISKKPVDPAAPATSALAYGRFARAQSLLMLVGGLLISAGIGLSFYLSALGIVSMAAASTTLMVVSILCVVAIAIVSLRLGQSGGRLAGELRTTDELARDDDEHWFLGSFYFNRDDPSIIVPKRFGIGWTINHARPAAWLAIAAFLLVTLAFLFLIERAVG